MWRWLPALFGLFGVATGCGAILGIEEIPESSGDDGGAGISGGGAGGGSGGSSGSGASGGTSGSWAGGSGGGTTLTVAIEGEAGNEGAVTSTPPGIDCPGTCSASFPTGTTITLTSAPAQSTSLVSWQGGGCTGSSATCDVQLDAATTVTATFALNRNIAFVTSTTQAPGGIGGLDAADSICAARAQAAGLPGTYVAWLSSSTTNARNRLGSARGWLRVDGKPFTDTLFDLLDGKIFYPLRITETGEDLKDSGGYVATASNNQGQLAGSTCSDYTATTGTLTTGNPASTTNRWTNHSATSSCGSQYRLYCFGTDFQAPVSITPASGRKVFVSSEWLPNAGGVADADAHCQTDATAAGLSGQFIAMLATTTASAPSRLDPSGNNWVRPDGVPIAASAADFVSGVLETAPNQRANGTYASGYVWTGAQSWGSTASTNCTNWTATLSTVSAYRADFETSAPLLKTSTTSTCTTTSRYLLCVEN